MSARTTNLALLVLTMAAIVSGGLMFAIGTGWSRWPTLAHGAIGIAVVALGPAKGAISRRGFRHHGPGSTASLVLALLVGVALVTGFAHRAGVRHLGPLLAMQVHVAVALLAVPLLGWHVVARPVRPRRADLSRRNLLRGAAAGAGALLVTAAAPAASTRPTRSLPRGSFYPPAMPVTSWLDDRTPRIEVDHWRLEVAGNQWTLAELDAFGDVLEATLDCTGGWYATQRWHGARLDRLLPDDAALTSIVVRSATGYWRRFPWSDRRSLFVATRVGDQRLSPGHGFPARLVAPSRRGFWWVKWLDSIEPSGRPWWWQPPFPLT